MAHVINVPSKTSIVPSTKSAAVGTRESGAARVAAVQKPLLSAASGMATISGAVKEVANAATTERVAQPGPNVVMAVDAAKMKTCVAR
jgi:hypothetical protein